ncbi:MAG: tRNA (guanosine(37)-N1)-methyltransferase TrmD [Elusimicrobiales bacterium]|nr:tRNA (guanosine(37)-N1)-methyltransferase TrmD [Elusimicrobiales bacterium]
MRIDVATLFPELVDFPLSKSIVGRARERGILRLGFVNPRDFTHDRHKSADDRPYGGGPGMIMLAEPLYQAVKSVKKKGSFVVFLGPQGRPFSQKEARRLSKKKHLVLVCGHYEGVDQRFIDTCDMQLSLGDFILTGGEPAAAAVIDCITRLLPGVFAKEGVSDSESFSEGLLEAPHYTRPAVWRRKKVPPELLGGNHAEIEKWRAAQSLDATRRLRPDLLKRRK